MIVIPTTIFDGNTTTNVNAPIINAPTFIINAPTLIMNAPMMNGPTQALALHLRALLRDPPSLDLHRQVFYLPPPLPPPQFPSRAFIVTYELIRYTFPFALHR